MSIMMDVHNTHTGLTTQILDNDPLVGFAMVYQIKWDMLGEELDDTIHRIRPYVRENDEAYFFSDWKIIKSELPTDEVVAAYHSVLG